MLLCVPMLMLICMAMLTCMAALVISITSPPLLRARCPILSPRCCPILSPRCAPTAQFYRPAARPLPNSIALLRADAPQPSPQASAGPRKGRPIRSRDLEISRQPVDFVSSPEVARACREEVAAPSRQPSSRQLCPLRAGPSLWIASRGVGGMLHKRECLSTSTAG